jgi:membrane peptidoglycan carboxypeptidase
VLASIIRSPTGYDPDRHPATLRRRWQFVVDGMVSEHWLAKADRARLHFPAVLPRRDSLFGANAGPNGLALRAIRQELSLAGFTDARLRAGGLTVRTTLDHAAQTAAVDSMGSVLAGRPPQLHGAAVAINPGTGAVLAYYGGGSPGADDFTQAWRLPGQAMEPFLLATAVQQGIPVDANLGLGGRSLVDATTHTNGRAYALLQRLLDPSRLTATAFRFGVPPGDAYEVRPMDLATAYAALAAGGVMRAPYLVEEVLDPTGRVLYRHQPSPARRVLSASVANDVAYAMHGVAAAVGHPLAGRMSAAAYGGNYLAADSWLAGFTPQVATVAWVGLQKPAAGTRVLPVHVGMPRGLPGLVWQRTTEAALRGQPALPFATKPLLGHWTPPVPVRPGHS